MVSTTPDLTAFSRHVEHIEALVAGQVSILEQSEPNRSIAAILDGGVAAHFRKAVSLAHRREMGAFFTGSALRKLAISDPPLESARAIADPTCGVGDLLVAAAEKLELGSSLTATLEHWGNLLYGMDIQPLFIRATKARLALLAQQRGKWDEPVDAAKLFQNIKVGNALVDTWSPPDCGTLLLNPPFGAISSAEGYEWGSGLISGAAVFSLELISKVADGCGIRLILPDVLRSGSRYARWRREIEKLIIIDSISNLGQFDPHTDVDVFLLCGRKGKSEQSFWKEQIEDQTISKFFTVRVGTVVPHRDEVTGQEKPYLTARTLAGKSAFCSDNAPKLRHSGKSFSPPFVLVRRTSRPGDEPRAKASLITGTEPVFVENHLIVLSPLGGADCADAIRVLHSKAVSDRLNERIRCRHLTVGAVSTIPWPKSDEDDGTTSL